MRRFLGKRMHCNLPSEAVLSGRSRIIGKKILRGVIEMKFNVLRSKISAPAVFISVFPF